MKKEREIGIFKEGKRRRLIGERQYWDHMRNAYYMHHKRSDSTTHMAAMNMYTLQPNCQKTFSDSLNRTND